MTSVGGLGGLGGIGSGQGVLQKPGRIGRERRGQGNWAKKPPLSLSSGETNKSECSPARFASRPLLTTPPKNYPRTSPHLARPNTHIFEYRYVLSGPLPFFLSYVLASLRFSLGISHFASCFSWVRTALRTCSHWSKGVALVLQGDCRLMLSACPIW